MRFSPLLLVLALCFTSGIASAQGVPTPSTPRIMIDSTGTLMDASNPLPVTGTFSASIGSAAITVAGPTGYATDPTSVVIASSLVTLSTPGPSAYATDPQFVSGIGASATANPSNALAVMLNLSDNSGYQRWFTALTTLLGDGVNGQNTAAVAPWIFNGTAWDRLRGINGAVDVRISSSTVTLATPGPSGYASEPLFIVASKTYDYVSTTPSYYTTYLATNAVTLLSAICSYTPPCIIQVDHQGTQWVGEATSTVTTVQKQLKYYGGDKWTFKPKVAGVEYGFAADPSATSTVVIQVTPLTVAP